MPQKQDKLFEYTDRFDTKVGLVEIVSGWKRSLSVRFDGVEATGPYSPTRRERRESAGMAIREPEELSDFVAKLGAFLNDPKIV